LRSAARLIDRYLAAAPSARLRRLMGSLNPRRDAAVCSYKMLRLFEYVVRRPAAGQRGVLARGMLANLLPDFCLGIPSADARYPACFPQALSLCR
jgi:hypothetical protein